MLYIPDPFKRCSKCGERKTTNHFSVDKHAKDGLFYWCKQCKRDFARIYRSNNRTKIRQIQRRCDERRPEVKRERDRLRRIRDKDKIVVSVRNWKQKHPENVKASEHRRRARIRNSEGIHTAAQVREQYSRQKGLCYYCKKGVGNHWHLDHVIPLTRGGSNGPENLVIACSHCNTSKKAKLPHEWPEGGRLL